MGEHIAYKALGLRNSLLEGDLITATATEMITADLPEVDADILNQTNSADKKIKKFPAIKDVPMASCFAFKKGNQYAVMLYSRRMEQSTPITLEWPFTPSGEAHIYTLGSESPSAHNIEDEVVKVKEERLPSVSRKDTFVLPPYTIMVRVVKK